MNKIYERLSLNIIDLSVSPSPRTQTSQWQSGISCMGSGTQTSSGFRAIEKHWNMQISHRCYGFMIQKWKNDVPGELVTLIPGMLRGWAIYIFVLYFLNSNKMSLSIQPQYKWRQKCSLSYNLHLLKQNVNVILCFSKVSLAKTS